MTLKKLDRKVLLLDENGDEIGIVEFSIAQTIAREKDLDVFFIDICNRPPIAQIMEYGKYRYLRSKGKINQKK